MERRFVRGASMVPITMHIGKRMGSCTKGISISILRWRVHTKISQAYAKLSHANISNGDLFRTDLSQAKLIGANLVRANLSNAILEDFRGVIIEERSKEVEQLSQLIQSCCCCPLYYLVK